MRTVLLITVGMASACIPINGEGVSVELLTCTPPVFSLDSNYCAERFVVVGPGGTVWTITASVSDNEFASPCIDELNVKLPYGGLVLNSDASEALDLYHEYEYTYEASFEGQQEMPDSWSGSFTYACPSALPPK